VQRCAAAETADGVTADGSRSATKITKITKITKLTNRLCFVRVASAFRWNFATL
jgi:hypothetical protein